MRKKILMFLNRHMKPCYFYKVAKGPNKDHVNCGAYHAYRNRCKTGQCPYFSPTFLYKMARWLGMVRY